MPNNKGNINLYSRPKVVNPDGTTSTVRSMSFNLDGKEVLVPTVERTGKGVLSDEGAIDQFMRTGEHLGIFGSPNEATKYAEDLHNRFERGDYDVPLASSRKDVNPDLLSQLLVRMLAEDAKK